METRELMASAFPHLMEAPNPESKFPNPEYPNPNPNPNPVSNPKFPTLTPLSSVSKLLARSLSSMTSVPNTQDYSGILKVDDI